MIRSFICLAAILPLLSQADSIRPAGKPNIVIILSDDAGYGEFSMTGSKTIETPRIDSIAKSGIQFTNGYVSGTGWSGNWTGATSGAAGFTIKPVGGGFGSLPVSGQSVSNGTQASVTYSRKIGRTIQVGDGDGAEAWISGVLSLSGTAPGQGIEVSLGTTGISVGKLINGRLGMEVNGSWYNAQTTGGGTTGTTPTGTYLFVLRLLENGANTDLTLFLGNNPAMDISDTANFPYQVSQSVVGPVALESLGLWVNKPDAQNVDFDEIRIGKTYLQVIPPVVKPQVTVTASGTPMEEGAVSADFTFTRTLTDGDLTIAYTLAGSATAGPDYFTEPVSVTIPAGVAAATVTVTPLEDAIEDPDETVILSISPNAAYTIGSPDSATLTIVDNDGPQPVGPPWSAQDVGSVAPGANSSTVNLAAGLDNSDLFALTGSGTISATSTSDGMHFVSQPVTGDCEIIARVASHSGTDNLTRAGVAIRAGTSGDAVAAQTLLRGGVVTPNFITRASTGAANSTSQGSTSVTAPYWVKLVREGDDFTSFVSPDGSAWSQIGNPSTLANMPATAEVGLFVSSGSIITTNTATFDHVEIKQNIVSVTAPLIEASEGSPVQGSTFTISRGQNPPNSALSMDLGLSGAALVDTDYTLAGGAVSVAGATATVTIPAGQAQVDLILTPLNDLLNEGSENVVFTLPAGATYSLGTPASGASAIADAPVASLTVNSNPVEGGANTGAGTYYIGSTQAITATPSQGWHFTSWTGTGIGNINDASTTVTIDAGKSVTANFAIDTHTLTYTAGPNGSVTGITPQTIDYDSAGTSVTAVPATGYHFVNWSDGSTSNPRTDLSVTADQTITANFVLCRVTGITMLNKKLTLNFEGTAGFAYDVERSTDLFTWVPVATNLIAPPGGLFTYIEDPATAPNAFYRLKLH